MLKSGIKGKQSITVDEKKTAKYMKSGNLNVFATPAMIALMEKTAYMSVETDLEDEMDTVGTLLEVKHISATPIGMRVTCESELVEVDGKRLVFRLNVYDEVGPVGEGKHERFIINSQKFQCKTDNKNNKFEEI